RLQAKRDQHHRRETWTDCRPSASDHETPARKSRRAHTSRWLYRGVVELSDRLRQRHQHNAAFSQWPSRRDHAHALAWQWNLSEVVPRIAKRAPRRGGTKGGPNMADSL